MKIILLTFMALALTACSKTYDKYLGYWQLEDTKYPKILEIRKEDKETYLVNENILSTSSLRSSKKEYVLEKSGENGLGVNNGLTVVPFNLSEDGKTLRIDKNKYVKISEDVAKAAKEKAEQEAKNKEDCINLSSAYYKERAPLNGFFIGDNPNKAKIDAIKAKYTELQKKIPNCNTI